MYRNFFSLSELPFSISPDPKYLFMSERHKEALSHLTYGLGEVGGFALLTGEVGTGKTTISRCLMEQLPENTQAAFILNPTLSSQELLATLCDQLKIRYRKTGASLKNLTDKISEKLLKNHENDINTLLIIDEAQHLQPEVLEQLRLLTNLETNTKKLLQVILIGQPELQQLLQRRDLRQLAQRITARYHLMPLTKTELKQYVEHRLQVANCSRSVFDKGALAKVHELSQGIPRLINLLCHSALMQAYNQNDSVVNRKTVLGAAERALGQDFQGAALSRTHYFLVASTTVSLIVLVALAAFWWEQVQHSKAQEYVNSSLDSVVNNVPPIPTIEDEISSDGKSLNKITSKTEMSNKGSLIISSSEISSTMPTGRQLSAEITLKPIGSDEVLEGPALESQAELLHLKKQATVSVTSPPQKKSVVDYQITKIEGVSSDLLERFQAAIDETQFDNAKKNAHVTDPITDNYNGNLLSDDIKEQGDIKPLTEMSQKLQNAIPTLTFEQHIYVSDGGSWVNVNGRDRYEGDYISQGLIIEKILPQQLVLSFQGEKFSLPALTNW